MDRHPLPQGETYMGPCACTRAYVWSLDTNFRFQMRGRMSQSVQFRVCSSHWELPNSHPPKGQGRILLQWQIAMMPWKSRSLSCTLYRLSNCNHSHRISLFQLCFVYFFLWFVFFCFCCGQYILPEFVFWAVKWDNATAKKKEFIKFLF